MKTFLLNIPQRLRIKSQKLDAQAVLCDKAWTVFNDDGVKQLFIFQPDGSLLITIDGVVYNSTWKYLPVNNSVVITSEGKSTMFHPAYLDNVVFALEQDGGMDCVLMIDEANQNSFLPKSLSELQSYFWGKEQALIEYENRLREIENNRKSETPYADESKEHQDEEPNSNKSKKLSKDQKLKKDAIKLADELFPLRSFSIIFLSILLTGLYLLACYLLTEFSSSKIDFVDLAPYAVLVFFIGAMGLIILASAIHSKRIKKWKEDNQTDPRNKYLR